MLTILNNMTTKKAISCQLYTLYIQESKTTKERITMRALLVRFLNRNKKFSPADLI